MKSDRTLQQSSVNNHPNSWSKALLLSTLSVSIALTACGKKEDAAAGAGAGGMPPAEVVVAVAQRQSVPQFVELAGRTSAYQVSPVIPQFGGIILKRLFEEGSMVHAGQALYQIDPATAHAEVDAAQASVQRNKANLAALKVTASRYKGLIASNAVSKLDYDNALQQVALSEADLAASQAALRNSQIKLDYATIRSPITGQSGVSNVTAGALVVANQTTPLVTIQQMDPMYVDISQSSADMLKLRQQISAGTLGKPQSAQISLTLEDGSAYPIKGRLEFSNASVDPTSGSVILRAVVPNPSGLLLPGMYVKAKINQGIVHNGILLPQQAVTHNPQGDAVVLVVAEDGTVSQRTIQTTNTQGNQWIVTGGLENGERVILEGSQKAKPGSKVHATVAPSTDPATPATAPSNAPVAAPTVVNVKKVETTTTKTASAQS